jgi:hypothetical protein
MERARADCGQDELQTVLDFLQPGEILIAMASTAWLAVSATSCRICNGSCKVDRSRSL